MGRFLNADAFASTGQGVLGNNMFAYCGNNPVNCVDPTGYCICAAGGLKNQFANSNKCPSCGHALGGGGEAIVLGIAFIGATLAESVESAVSVSVAEYLWDSIARSYAHAAKRTYKSPEEIHHLVAKASWNAAPAAAILNEILPDGVENPINKIIIKTGLHRRLHTKLYYGIANAMVITAYHSANDPAQQQMNVVIVLGLLRGIVEYLNALAPY